MEKLIDKSAVHGPNTDRLTSLKITWVIDSNTLLSFSMFSQLFSGQKHRAKTEGTIRVPKTSRLCWPCLYPATLNNSVNSLTEIQYSNTQTRAHRRYRSNKYVAVIRDVPDIGWFESSSCILPGESLHFCSVAASLYTAMQERQRGRLNAESKNDHKPQN